MAASLHPTHQRLTAGSATGTGSPFGTSAAPIKNNLSPPSDASEPYMHPCHSLGEGLLRQHFCAQPRGFRSFPGTFILG